MSRIMALTLAAALFASTSSALADWHGHGGGYHGGLSAGMADTIITAAAGGAGVSVWAV